MKMSGFFGKFLLVGFIMLYRAGFAQGPSARATAPQNVTGENLIRAYYGAYVKKDWNSLAKILADGFTFSSPVDEHISLQNYKEKCWPNSANTKRFDIQKLMVNGNEGFVTYNAYTNSGKLFRNTEYFRFKDGKILSDECFFGPGVKYPNSGQ